MARKPYANQDLEGSILNIEAGFEQAFRKILSRLRAKLKKIKAGQGVSKTDALVASKIKSMIHALEDEINRAGFKKILATQGKEMKRIASVILKESKSLGLEDFDKSEIKQIKKLIDGSHKKLLKMRGEIAGDLEKVLIRQSVGADFEDVINAMSLKLRGSVTRASTEAEKIVAAFHTQTRVEHSEKNGVKWFWYRGPQDGRNRDFCARFVNTRVTVAILEKHSTSYGRSGLTPVYAYLGEYNCRHELAPLPNPKSHAKYPIGPRGAAAAQPTAQPTKARKPEKPETKKRKAGAGKAQVGSSQDTARDRAADEARQGKILAKAAGKPEEAKAYDSAAAILRINAARTTKDLFRVYQHLAAHLMKSPGGQAPGAIPTFKAIIRKFNHLKKKGLAPNIPSNLKDILNFMREEASGRTKKKLTEAEILKRLAEFGKK
jgi:hypothetical protein